MNPQIDFQIIHIRRFPTLQRTECVQQDLFHLGGFERLRIALTHKDSLELDTYLVYGEMHFDLTREQFPCL